MTYRQSFRKSKLAIWGFRLSVISAHLVVFTLLLHRFGGQSTAVAHNVLQIGFIAAFVAFIISVIASVQIWDQLLHGFGKAVAGIIISLFVLAWPLSQIPRYLTTPKQYDVSTDLKSPPVFQDLLKYRTFGSNPTNFVKREGFAPDIQTLRIKKSGQDAFDLVRQLVLKRKWKIVSIQPPEGDAGVGKIEAVDRSIVLGAPDDIVLRIRSGGTHVSVLDIRSASRFGSFDLGRNQERIHAFLDDFISQNSNVERVESGENPFFSPDKDARKSVGKQTAKKAPKKIINQP